MLFPRNGWTETIETSLSFEEEKKRREFPLSSFY